MLESKVQMDISTVNCPGDDSRTPSQRPAMASTNNQMVQLQLNKLKSNGFDGESRRLAIVSTNSLSHVTVNRVVQTSISTVDFAVDFDFDFPSRN